MSRFLFVVPPLEGHVNPALSVARALTARGHDVAWAGSEKFLRPLAGPDAAIYRTGLRLYRPQGERGFAALKSLWAGYLIPLARFTLPAVDAAIGEYQPDVVVADQHAVAGAIAAHRRGLPWATLAPTLMELTRPYRSLPQVEAWIAGRLADLCASAGLETGAGLDAGAVFDPLNSPDLVLAFVSRELTAGLDLPDRVVATGPVLGGRPAGPDFPWDWLDPGRRHVLVTVGTLATGIALDFYTRMTQALAPLAGRVQGILVGAPDALATAPDAPPNVRYLTRVPLLDLLPRLDAVVCHGGINTVCETLSRGIPLVIAPIRHDQPVTASQVVAAGAGLRVHFGRARPDQLAAAVTGVLDDPSFRANADRLRRSFAAAGGAAAAAGHLESLSRHKR